LYRFGEGALKESRIEQSSSEIRDRIPTDADLNILLPRVKDELDKVRRQEQLSWEQWILLFAFQDYSDSNSLSAYKRIVPPADRYWADPFVLSTDGAYWIFFEEYMLNSGKGHISAMPIQPDGTVGAPTKVLEQPYHLSYPCVFDLNGTFYMVPETKQNRTIELYECVSFPDQWKLRRFLLDGIQAVDATVFRHREKWWMFVNVVDNKSMTAPWDELCIFSSDDPITGEWTPHQRNPVVCDVRRARPSGLPFERNGVLYRPGQDCSRCYGHGIRLHEVVTLTPDQYDEREVASIEPDWTAELIGVHTLNSIAGLSVADALIRRPRISNERN
jgi:hypothetical protein